MRFHRYGQVDIAIEGPDGDSTFARMFSSNDDQPIYQRRDTGFVTTDEHGQPDHVMAWYRLDDPSMPPLGYHHTPNGIEKDNTTWGEDPWPILFDAAATLCWHDFELWQQADSAMGDPNP